jgi:serine/threonine-protein kinase
MSPEQCTGAAPLTPASDVYSLGIILYEMLTGGVPFSADTPLAVALKQVSQPPRAPSEIVPSTPAELERVVLHALAKDPRARPANADEFRRELHDVAVSLGLELSDSPLSPSLADLRSAGTESPSGRLVIDLATLRQVQAANSGDGLPAAAIKEVAKKPTGSEKPSRLEFARMSVPFQKQISARNNKRIRLAALVIVLVIAILGSGVLAALWWRGTDSANGAGSANANASASPSPTASSSPSPSPTLAPKSIPKPAPKKKPGKLKSIWNKMKGIIK